MYQLIAFDMDGTLLNSRKQILPKSRNAVAKAAQAGAVVILNTGRCLAELGEYLQALPEIRYVNCASGAMVYDARERKALYSRLLGTEKVRRILELGALEQAMPNLLLEESIVQKSHWERIEEFGMGAYKDTYERVATMWEDIAGEYGRNPFPAAKVNLYHRNRESRERTIQRIRSGGPEVSMALGEAASLEMSEQGVDKGAGLRMLCGHLSIPLERTIVVGDADNDREAMKAAGLAVAMGNAAASVRAIAGAVVADCDHDGCAEAVERYLFWDSTPERV